MNRPKMPWEEVSIPAWVAAFVVGVDLAWAAFERFCLGWPMFPSPSEGGSAFIFGEWSLLGRGLLCWAFLTLMMAQGVRPRAFGLIVDEARARAVAFAKAVVLLLAVATTLAAIYILALRVLGKADMIRPPVYFESADERMMWIIVFVGVLPPLEEFLYRGTLHSALRRRVGPWTSITVGAFVFGLLHYFYGIPPAYLLNYAAAGAMLAWIYERTGSLVCSWLVHTCANLIAAALPAWPGLFEWLRS